MNNLPFLNYFHDLLDHLNVTNCGLNFFSVSKAEEKEDEDEEKIYLHFSQCW